jgi:hypothetical protein
MELHKLSFGVIGVLRSNLAEVIVDEVGPGQVANSWQSPGLA